MLIRNPYILLMLLILSLFDAAMNSFAAESDVVSELIPISIKALDAFHIEGKLEPSVLKVRLILKNKGERGLRIRNGIFKVVMNPNNASYKGQNSDMLSTMDADMIGTDKDSLDKQLYIGQTKIAVGKSSPSGNIATSIEYIEIPSKSEITKIFEIELSSAMEDRIRTLYLLMNYIGFPKANRDISLTGEATVGRFGENGWTYKNNVHLNLICSP